MGRKRKYGTVEEAYEAIKASTKKYMANNQVKRLYIAAKQRAKLSRIEFTIKETDIIIPELCPIMGIPITNIYGLGRQATNASIDRIDSNIGYTPTNIWIISDLANRMKQDATKEQLIAFSTGVLKLLTND